jgi:hypothetical protein
VTEIKPYGKEGYVAFTQLGVAQDFAQELANETQSTRRIEHHPVITIRNPYREHL